MMRVFGAYRVGHAADGSPLTPPARFCKTVNNHNDRQGANAPEGMQP